MTNRTVAFIDILGFKEIVNSAPAHDIGTKFSNIIGKTLPAMNKSPRDFPDEPSFFPNFGVNEKYCISFAFSDSIILVSHDETEESCLALLIYALRVSQILIGSKFPVRGAISYGDMYIDLNNSLFLGSALTYCYELEQRQNWIGLVIDDSIPNVFPDVLTKNEPTTDIRPKLFPKYQVPMKNGPVRDLHTLNWRWNLVAPKGTKSFFNHSGNWSAKVKIDAALEYAKVMRDSGLTDHPIREDIPIEVRTIYLAEGPPTETPPEHGDEY